MIDKNKLKGLIKEEDLKGIKSFDDLVAQISKDVMETMLEGEMVSHLGYKKHDYSAKNTDNSRNGHSQKTVNSKVGEIPVKIPRDRKSEFEPVLVKKHQTDISGLEEKVISMYAKGMTVRDIKAHIADIYNYEISTETISNITDMVMEKARDWQNRPLEKIYAIVFMDAMFFKVKQDGQIKDMAVLGLVGISLEGHKECLGLWMAKTESSKYWLNVLNEISNRGVKDILIFCIDGLPGFSEAIKTVYPKAEIQRCIVHQVRNSLKYVAWTERKEVAKDLRIIYHSPSEEEGLRQLDKFKGKWSKYPHIYNSWKKNWADLSTFFKYPEIIRRLIYTTNAIESFNRNIKKVTKNRAVFPSQEALYKLCYLAVQHIGRTWTARVSDWSLMYAQLSVFFEERLTSYVN